MVRNDEDRRRPRVSAVAVLSAALLGLLMILGVGCDEDDEDCICCGRDVTAPAPPRGLVSVTGDTEVFLYWLSNTENDLAGYAIYWSTSPTGSLQHLIDVTPTDPVEESYVDNGLQNGTTYFYAVTAFDHNGNESEPSFEVNDTPRPQGTGTIASLQSDPDQAGFDFFNGRTFGRVIGAAEIDADFHYRGEEGELWTGPEGTSGEQVLIQDMGYTANFDEISFAPGIGDGYSPSGIVEAIAGHTYVLLTLDGQSGYYAKIRVRSVSPTEIRFDWAYQTAYGNQELSVP